MLAVSTPSQLVFSLIHDHIILRLNRFGFGDKPVHRLELDGSNPWMEAIPGCFAGYPDPSPAYKALVLQRLPPLASNRSMTSRKVIV